MGLRKLWNRTFLAGVLVGVAVVLLGRVAINESTLPDRVLAPMLVDDSPARADAIVVLGAGVVGQCVPNLNGMRRVLLGVKLLKDGRAPLLFITGGTGDGNCPVADAMAQLARDFGLPPDRLILERQSRNTHENGSLTAPMLRERGVSRILLVTDRLHMRRAAGVFERLGFAVEPVSVPIQEGHVNNVSMLSSGIREAVALGYYRLRGWTAPYTKRTDAMATTTVADGNDQRTGLGGSVNTPSVQTTGSNDRRPLVILGASYAAGWKLAELDGVPIVNAGVAGQQSFEMQARFDSDVTASRPRAVVLWGFINDIFRNDDAAVALMRMRESYTEMVKRARAQGIEPIIATEVTIRPPKAFIETVTSMVAWALGKQSYQDRVNGRVIEGNRWLTEFARREGLLVLDLQNALADTDGRRRRAFAADDGSHISPEGYEALTNYARPILSKRLRSSALSGTSQQ